MSDRDDAPSEDARREPGSGAVDKDMRDPATKMDREVHETNADMKPADDPRGRGRQERAQQAREREERDDVLRGK